MTGGLRVRALLDRQFEVVVLALVVLAAVGGFLTYGAYAQPNTTTEPNEVTVWAPNGTFTHGSTVTDNESKLAGVFEPGQSVESRSVYYTNIMPELSGEFAFQYAADSGELDATIERTLVIRSVGQSRDEGQVEYWRQTEPLGSGSATLSPGEAATVPYDVNVSAAVARADRVHERLGDPGQTRVSVNVTVALSGTAGGEAVDRTLTYALPLAVEGQVYRVEPVGGVEPVTRTEQVTVTEEPGVLGGVGGPLLLGLSLLGLAGLAYARSEDRLALTEAERAWLAYRDDRTDFDDWISTIRLPEEARSLPVAEADTLADLVDFAIDTDNSVLEQPGGGAYHVVHDGYRYTFEAPPEPSDRTTETAREHSERGETASSALPGGRLGERASDFTTGDEAESTQDVATDRETASETPPEPTEGALDDDSSSAVSSSADASSDDAATVKPAIVPVGEVATDATESGTDTAEPEIEPASEADSTTEPGASGRPEFPDNPLLYVPLVALFYIGYAIVKPFRFVYRRLLGVGGSGDEA